MKRMIDWQVLSLTNENLDQFPDGEDLPLTDILKYFTANELVFTDGEGEVTFTHTYPALDRYVGKTGDIITDLTTTYGHNDHSADTAWMLTFTATRQSNGLYTVSYTVVEV